MLLFNQFHLGQDFGFEQLSNSKPAPLNVLRFNLNKAVSGPNLLQKVF